MFVKKQIGVVGMAVMGQNLALNIENCGYSVSIFNRSSKITKEFFCKHNKKKIFPYYSIKDFLQSLKTPRLILLMVKSGKATDDIINLIIPYLQKNDILIDGGNSFYKDTIRRSKKISKMGFRFIGAGISGGEKGALYGPSIMPGGDYSSYKFIKPILKKISAKYNNIPCVSYIGNDGSGHYVKMVHNGIEYADMQLISEVYFLLKYFLGLNNKELSKIFNSWNKGELKSYLIKITSKIFLKKNNKGKYLIDLILDCAENKGTGTWVSNSALDLGVPLSLITESVFSRYISSLKSQRILASDLLKGPKNFKIIKKGKEIFIENLRRALYLGKIIAYSQGFSQLKVASKKYSWNLNFSNIAKIFRSGCIIKANFLQKIKDVYKNNNKVVNLLLTPYFKNVANDYQNSLREIVSFSVLNGISVPVLSSAISYYDSYRSKILPSNLIQAQRDLFGAHTYKRIDKKGIFHTNWD